MLTKEDAAFLLAWLRGPVQVTQQGQVFVPLLRAAEFAALIAKLEQLAGEALELPKS